MTTLKTAQANDRTAGQVARYRLIGIAGSALLTVGCLLELLNPSISPEGVVVNATNFRVFLVALTLAAPGLFFTQLGFFRAGAAGSTWLSRAALFVGGAGCFFIGLPALLGIFTLGNYPIQRVGQLATMMLAPILFGVAALRAKQVTLWKRAWPLLTGLWPPVMFGLAVPAGFPPFLVPAIAGILWVVWAAALPSRASASK